MSGQELINLLLEQEYYCVVYYHNEFHLYAAFADLYDAEECLRVQQIAYGGFSLKHPSGK